jgi:transposase
MRGRWEPSDAQWQLIEPTLRPKRRAEGRGRPWQDTGAMLNGIWRVLGTGARGRELPERYPPYQACHRCFQPWVREGKLERLWRVLAEELPARGRLPREEAFIDASFPGARKGASGWGRPSAAKGRKSPLSPMITVLLSPFLSKALRRPKANLSKASPDTASSTASRRD